MLTVSASLAPTSTRAADQGNAIADDWALAQADRPGLPGALAGRLVCQPSWPSQETVDSLRLRELDPMRAWEGWLDSTLALRDGLSVVEVFAVREPEGMFLLQLD